MSSLSPAYLRPAILSQTCLLAMPTFHIPPTYLLPACSHLPLPTFSYLSPNGPVFCQLPTSYRPPTYLLSAYMHLHIACVQRVQGVQGIQDVMAVQEVLGVQGV